MRTIGYHRPFFSCAATLFLAAAVFAAEPASMPKLSVTSDRPSLRMKSGESITLVGSMTENGKLDRKKLILQEAKR